MAAMAAITFYSVFLVFLIAPWLILALVPILVLLLVVIISVVAFSVYTSARRKAFTNPFKDLKLLRESLQSHMLQWPASLTAYARTQQSHGHINLFVQFRGQQNRWMHHTKSSTLHGAICKMDSKLMVRRLPNGIFDCPIFQKAIQRNGRGQLHEIFPAGVSRESEL